jgi:hypothetical protein
VSTFPHQLKLLSATDQCRVASSDSLSANLHLFICRICVGTWNVGGKFPPSDLDIQEWLDMEEPADIYIFG